MRIIFSILVFLCCFYGISFADEIYMNDLSVIRGKIIQVTDKNVEYSQEGKPFLIVPREHVFRIKYDDGQVVQIADVKGRDKIFLKNGSVIEGTVIKATRDIVMYYTDQESVVPSDNVIKIVYANGKVMQISELPAEALTDAELETRTEEPVIRSGGFLDSYIWLNTSGAISFIWGELYNKEEGIYKDRRPDLIAAGYSDKDDGPYTDHTGLNGGFELNLMFPAIKYPQARAFSLTGIKLGLKSTYVFSRVEQSLNDESLPDSGPYDGTILKYRSVNAGPELNIVFSPRSDYFNMVIQLYLLGGYIHNGKLSAVSGLRDMDDPTYNDRSQYTANFTGYSGTVGANVNFALNRVAPIIVGYGFYYSYARINLDRDVPVYDGADSIWFNEFGITLSVGVHL